MLEEYLPFIGLIIFGNIENLILASHGVVKGANPVKLAIASICFVIMWVVLGTLGTVVFMEYASVIELIGGLAIVILGLQSMVGAFKYNDDDGY
ncbi:hypothetical protein PXD04_10555 [Methanosphaera sp. ISO3-F5]|uniref:hypothetical protein n=1 Tax=Methanosphaera sp. ISO3-F5 TaxID=1452353 RepID=UPI002B25CCDB|nr:hypothetical protein [Methanosphaera sp. ISO3-F5]WQH64132.1 hypothetical protein PXD04_10555 [Methanosphaera sp. ISO3-F5]